MSVFDTPLTEIPFRTIDGGEMTLGDLRGHAVLVVNVASQCGLTPQYAGLQELYDRYRDRGFQVVGFPCNQFGNQEPGTHDEIKTFCESSFGVTFPLMGKLEVNGPDRHPLYAALTAFSDAEGYSGDIRWNFEKFLISPEGEVVMRFTPLQKPDNEALIGAIEESLPVRAEA
jgi:glutathione peroxidase